MTNESSMPSCWNYAVFRTFQVNHRTAMMYKSTDSKLFYPKDFLYYRKTSENIGPKEKHIRNAKKEPHSIHIIDVNSSEENGNVEPKKEPPSNNGFWSQLKSKIRSNVETKKQSKLCLLWLEYCKKSSIHGVQYIVDGKLNYLER